MDPVRPHADALRSLPAIDHLLRQPPVLALIDEFSRPVVVRAARDLLGQLRAALRRDPAATHDVPSLILDLHRTLQQRRRPGLRRAVNATGIVLHTGLGRAPLADEAVEAICAAARYSNLELDLESGERGDRQAHVRPLLRELTGAEDALVVNNNAAATYLSLHVLACGAEVIVSRGQLVEIGGSYRMPDIMAAAGCLLVEVGTTNRTRAADYEARLTERTRVLLRVHTSNYRMEGFVESTPLPDLVALARRRPQVSVVDDLGSGLLDLPPGRSEHAARRRDLDGRERKVGPHAESPLDWDEPTVRASLADGADLALFSGDKLLGGPQAGIIVGRAALVSRLRSSPLARALRPDKLTLAALEATLRLYDDPHQAAERIPALRMLTQSPAQLEHRARHIEQELRRGVPQAALDCRPDRSYAGGGALPGLALPTWVVRIRAEGVTAATFAQRLRTGEIPVIPRLHDDWVVLDVRTLLPGDEPSVADAVTAALRSDPA
jgi:L-seryl-tRNA(Ser) seleniumtransferase